MSVKRSLSQTDWIMAAFRALTAGGPQAIRAETIARDLNVSKGSFYWHFKDVPAFKIAMIDHWQQVATDAIIAAVDDASGPAETRLHRLIEIASSANDIDYGGPMAEAAIRDWGRYDPVVEAAVQRVDQKRMDYVEGLFQGCGISAVQSARKSRQLYCALIGLQHQATGPNRADDLANLLNTLLTISGPS